MYNLRLACVKMIGSQMKMDVIPARSLAGYADHDFNFKNIETFIFLCLHKVSIFINMHFADVD